MLKRRLIPKLQLRASQKTAGQPMVLVTTKGFDQTFEIGDPVSQAKIYEAQVADELIFVDLDASRGDRKTYAEVVEQAAEELFMPFTVGGGVRSLTDFRRLLNSGADKVAVNTFALERPKLIEEAAGAFGAQCVVLSIDFRREPDGRSWVWSLGAPGQRTATRSSGPARASAWEPGKSC